MEELILIQKELIVAKTSEMEDYKTRKLEDILAELKPLLSKNDCYLILSDEPKSVGDRCYIVATATLVNAVGDRISATAPIRDAEYCGQNTEMQTSGATITYARKYALNGLFLLDNNEPDDDDKKAIKPKLTVRTPRTKTTKKIQMP